MDCWRKTRVKSARRPGAPPPAAAAAGPPCDVGVALALFFLPARGAAPRLPSRLRIEKKLKLPREQEK